MTSILFKHSGNFSKIEKYLDSLKSLHYASVLDKYCSLGVEALSSATPIESGKTSSSWSYEIVRNGSDIKIYFNNSNVVDGENIAILLQYGHGTNNGGYVIGRDYIKPAIRPIFDEIANEAWKEVLKA